MFPRSTEYAIRALVFLAAQAPGKLSGAREIAEAAHVPMPFLWKILQKLTAKRLVRSFRGVRGGYELAKPPERISVEKVVHEMGYPTMAQCLFGYPKCSRRNPCPLYALCSETREKIASTLRTTTLRDMARSVA
ncbi:MAG TPA: Rrf2 family transcriptional regulator [Terriglobales bacterium]|nr:Rrf2 family transcriptional regulator [Terriglobales bacterium]